MKIRTNSLLGFLAIGLISLASPALADPHEKTEKAEKTGQSAKREPSPEARAKMADAHQKMAECLRSTRPIQECKAEMHKTCEGMHGEGGCSMGHHAEDAAHEHGTDHKHGAKNGATGTTAAGTTK